MLYLLDRSTNVVDIGATMIESAAPLASQRDAKAGKVTRRIARVDGRSRAALAVKARLAGYYA
jgi:hypothetical protein